MSTPTPALCPICQTRPLAVSPYGRPCVTCNTHACRQVWRRQVDARRRRGTVPPCVVCGGPAQLRSSTCSVDCRRAHERSQRRAARARAVTRARALSYTPESSDVIDAAFARARAARLARERATGQRTYGVDVTWASSLTRETAGGRL